jgi:hypothetical protein
MGKNKELDLYLCNVCSHLNGRMCEITGSYGRKVCGWFLFDRCELIEGASCPLCGSYVYQDEFGAFCLNSDCNFTQELENFKGNKGEE